MGNLEMVLLVTAAAGIGGTGAGGGISERAYAGIISESLV